MQQGKEKFGEKVEPYQVDSLLEDGLEVALLVSHGGGLPSSRISFPSLLFVLLPFQIYMQQTGKRSLLVNVAFHLCVDGWMGVG